MRRGRSPSPKRERGDIMRISKSKLQRMIQVEVLRAMKDTDAETECLLGKVQQLESEPKYEFSICRLEAHIKKVGRRGQAAIAFIQNMAVGGTRDDPGGHTNIRSLTPTSQNQTRPAVLSQLATLTTRLDLPRSFPDSEEQKMETASQNQITTAVRIALSDMKKEPTSPPLLSAAITPLSSPQHKSQLATLTARLDLPRSFQDSEEEKMETASQNQITTAVRIALSDMKKEPTSPPPLSAAITPLSSPQHKRATRKPVQSAEEEVDHKTARVKEEPPEEERATRQPVQSAEKKVDHKTARVKEEPPEEEDGDAVPTLPPTLLPSILSEEAASYAMPRKPSLKLALIRNPPGLSVLWDMEDIDPAAYSYCVFMAMEMDKGSGVFPEWKTMYEVLAGQPPMYVMFSINQCKPGYRVCFSIIGKDRFGRYGPYSEVMPTRFPEGSA